MAISVIPAIYYSGSKSRIEVDFDEALVGRTLELLAESRSVR